MFATGETVGLTEWIIDDTCLVSFPETLHYFLCLFSESFFHTKLQQQNHVAAIVVEVF